MTSSKTLQLSDRTLVMIDELRTKLGVNMTSVIAIGVHVLHAATFLSAPPPTPTLLSKKNSALHTMDLARRLDNLKRIAEQAPKKKENPQCQVSTLKQPSPDPGPPATIDS